MSHPSTTLLNLPSSRLAAIPLAVVMAVSLLTFAGCSAGDPLASGSTDRQTRVIMNLLSVYYGDYLQAQSAPPKDAATFRAYIESRSSDLQRYNLQGPDQLLTSPRDGQPFVIVTGKRLAPKDSPGTPWAAYEQTGALGTQMAVQVRGGVHDLSPEEIAQNFGGKD